MSPLVAEVVTRMALDLHPVIERVLGRILPEQLLTDMIMKT